MRTKYIAGLAIGIALIVGAAAFSQLLPATNQTNVAPGASSIGKTPAVSTNTNVTSATSSANTSTITYSWRTLTGSSYSVIFQVGVSCVGEKATCVVDFVYGWTNSTGGPCGIPCQTNSTGYQIDNGTSFNQTFTVKPVSSGLGQCWNLTWSFSFHSYYMYEGNPQYNSTLYIQTFHAQLSNGTSLPFDTVVIPDMGSGNSTDIGGQYSSC